MLRRIAIGDETWVVHYTPEIETESLTCKHLHSSVKKVQDSAVSR